MENNKVYKGEFNDLLRDLINTSWETGWYAGAIEKNGAKMTNEQLKEYSNLMKESIANRINIREKIVNAFIYRS